MTAFSALKFSIVCHIFYLPRIHRSTEYKLPFILRLWVTFNSVALTLNDFARLIDNPANRILYANAIVISASPVDKGVTIDKVILSHVAL